MAFSRAAAQANKESQKAVAAKALASKRKQLASLENMRQKIQAELDATEQDHIT